LWDLTVDALLKLGGGNSTAKVKKQTQSPICFAIGLGDFKTVSGLPSLHTAFVGYFIKKVRRLGHLVIGINEYNTSQKCPRCLNQLTQLTWRWKRCDSCDVHLHRDVASGQCMAAIAKSVIETGNRPKVFIRPSHPPPSPTPSPQE